MVRIGWERVILSIEVALGKNKYEGIEPRPKGFRPIDLIK
jgi:hypothetical protein